MTAVNESDISRLLGPVLASGSEREPFVLLQDKQIRTVTTNR